MFIFLFPPAATLTPQHMVSVDEADETSALLSVYRNATSTECDGSCRKLETEVTFSKISKMLILPSGPGYAKIELNIEAYNSLNRRRTSGGDVFTVHAVSTTSVSAANVLDFHNGTYMASVFVTEGGEYDIRVQLGIVARPNIFSCYEQLKSRCRPQSYLSNADLRKVTSCKWEPLYYNGTQSFSRITVPDSYLKNGRCSSLKCSAEQMKHLVGVWRGKSTFCRPPHRCSVCGGSQKDTFDWKPQHYDVVGCTLELRDKRSMTRKPKCTKIQRKGIALGGDSVSKKGLSISAVQAGVPVYPYNLYDIFKFRGRGKDGALRAALLLGKHGVFVLGSGRHELSQHSVNEYITQFEENILPVLKVAIKKRSRVIWMLTSAPRPRVPISNEEDNAKLLRRFKAKEPITPVNLWGVRPKASCFISSLRKKLQCRHSIDACEMYAQRWDTTMELNYRMRKLLSAHPEIELFDAFSMTDCGVWEWYDDNMHYHQGSSGLSAAVLQALLNMIC